MREVSEVRDLVRSSRISLRAQIAGHVESAIAAGRFGEGRRLPSVRALAGRFGVHRNTAAAAYKELSRRGLVRPARGSGMYVASPALDPGKSPLEGGFRRFLFGQRALGRGAREIAAGLRSWSDAVGPARVLVAESEPELRAILLHELRRKMPGASLYGITPEELCATPRLARGCMVVGGPGVGSRIGAHLDPWTEFLPLGVGLRPEVGERVRRLPVPSVVGVVSASADVRARVRRLTLSAHGGGVGYIGAAPGDGRICERVRRVADLLLHDALSAPAVHGTRVRTAEIRLVSELSLEGLARYLGYRDAALTLP